MSDLTRREMVGLLGLATVAGLSGCSTDDVNKAARKADTAATPFTPQFFTAEEFAMVGLLADMIIPRDARSGSATDAGVPAFMDFMMADVPTSQKQMREGLTWLDAESTRRHGKPFRSLTDLERSAIADDLAWPKQAREGLADGVTFFTYFRNLTASGFWSSKMGIEDLDYRGNVFNAGWNGCPEPQLKKLGVQYSET